MSYDETTMMTNMSHDEMFDWRDGLDKRNRKKF